MYLSKAKEILKLNLDEAGTKMPSDTRHAVSLGIECINFRLALEQEDPEIKLEPLPGETVETDSP